MITTGKNTDLMMVSKTLPKNKNVMIPTKRNKSPRKVKIPEN